MSKSVWVVRAGQDSVFIQEFLTRKMVAIGWGKLGDLRDVHGRENVAALLRVDFPEYSRAQHTVATGQVYRFRDELIQGTTVMTYDSGARVYHFGTVSGDYVYHPELDEELQHTKQVEWTSKVSRDDLSPETKNSLGAIATIFCVSESAAAEIRTAVQGSASTSTSSVEQAQAAAQDESEIRRDTEQRALEFLQDRLAKVGWSEMQDLVAGLLRAMGYKTRVSPAGPDRGKDVFASPDGFGFQTPRIIVEVKHRTGAMGPQEIRAFAGVLRNGDNGLYVSTGGFTKEARYEAERANHHIALMDATDLGKAIVDHYDAMDAETRTILPLKKIYWPA